MRNRNLVKFVLGSAACSALLLSDPLIQPGFSQSNTQSNPQTGRDRDTQTTPNATGRDSQNPSQSGTERNQPGTVPNKSGNEPKQTARASASSAALAQAIEMNVAEVETGKMAADKATNPRVKEFAAMMVKDHTEALTKLRSAQGGDASSDLKPNAKHQQAMDRLSKLSGTQFDREYMRAMVTDHQAAAKFFEQHGNRAQAATTAGAPAQGNDLSGIAKELLPTVRHHLQMAQDIQKELQSGRTTKGTTENSNTGTSTGDSKTNNSTPNRPSSTPDANQK